MLMNERNLNFPFSPAVSRSITGSYINHIGKILKEQQFLRKEIER